MLDSAEALQNQPGPKMGTESPGMIVYDKPEYVRNVDKHMEVLKSAKSLFSKRTLTLYHWMYPNIPKQQLKANVAAAWENLPNTEKHFYISQVLGKFGYPQTSLMLNPQLQNLASASPHITPPIITTMDTDALHIPSQLSSSTRPAIIQNMMFESAPNELLQQQRKRQAEAAIALRKTAAVTSRNKLIDKHNLILAGNQLLHAGKNARNFSISHPQSKSSTFNVPQYEKAEFVKVVKDGLTSQIEETAVYEIRLANGGGKCVLNGRIVGTTTNGSGADRGGTLIDGSVNRYMTNMLVPPSMAMLVQNNANSANYTNRTTVKRRGRPPALKRKPDKKQIDEQYVTIQIDDDFPDDPELRQELQQFQSTLNLQM